MTNAIQFEAVKVALKQDRTGFVLTLNIHPDEIPEELLRDFVGARYGVAMARIESDETATHYDNRVKKAGQLCRNKDFQAWASMTDGLNDASEEAAINFIYSFCGIASRTELNGNVEAKAQFDAMVEEYEQYRKETDPF
jgi:hypothetical protein